MRASIAASDSLVKGRNKLRSSSLIESKSSDIVYRTPPEWTAYCIRKEEILRNMFSYLPENRQDTPKLHGINKLEVEHLIEIIHSNDLR